MSDVDPADLDVGDSFDLADSRLVIVGVLPASETPDGERDGPLYEARLWNDDGQQTVLYGPHNIRQGIAAGADYTGQVDVDDPVTPFWCAGCGYPCSHDERRDVLLVDADVCSYGCGQRAAADDRRDRMEARR